MISTYKFALTGVAIAVVLVAASFAVRAQGDTQTEKQQIEQRYRDLRAGPSAPARDPVAEAPTVRVTNPPAPTGVLEETGAPFPAVEFRASNRWQGYIGDQLIAVLAGAPAGTKLGQLKVLAMTRDGSNILEVVSVDLPGQPGKARIAAGNGTRLDVTTESGRSFTFDVATRTLTAK